MVERAKRFLEDLDRAYSREDVGQWMITVCAVVCPAVVTSLFIVTGAGFPRRTLIQS